MIFLMQDKIQCCLKLESRIKKSKSELIRITKAIIFSIIMEIHNQKPGQGPPKLYKIVIFSELIKVKALLIKLIRLNKYIYIYIYIYINIFLYYIILI
jgi:hypothetical protein